ncbi:ABC transporter permease [Nocardioides seonyuensis]|uniref:ABC transporter permease n=1 Tax=Nocardioides seonyuensis TaxID=2518371 RepID=A0A4P7IBE4_9ACTN|nr:ABC transporter permease [Nocardioides seonyuensis]QBX54365.1 ABC transporter permease [Nocardioides seonyuensis]
MSTTTASPAIDVSRTQPTPFGRLVAVELRKMRDTRSGFWLLLTTAGLLVLAAGITLLVVALNDEVEVTAGNIAQILTIPLSLLLPVLAITSVTSEWSQRTGLVTFALEPHRMRVMASKLVTVVALAVATIAVAFLLGAITNVVAGALSGNGADWTIDSSSLAWTLVSQVLFFLMAFGFGMVLLSTPAAIAIYYVVALLLPFMVYGPIYAIFSWGEDVVPWLDLGFAMTPLTDGSTDIEGKVYAQVAVTVLLWVVLPLALGWNRVRRTELK